MNFADTDSGRLPPPSGEERLASGMTHANVDRFQGPTSIDWSSLIGPVADALAGIAESRKTEDGTHGN